MADETTWLAVSAADVQKYMSAAVIAASNQKDTGGVPRLDGANGVVAGAVARVRGAIRNANRTPLSLTAGTVPAEAVQHTVMLCLEALVSASPRVAEYAKTDPFVSSIKSAKDWLADVAAGKYTPELPSNPGPYPSGPAWGDANGTALVGQTQTAGKVDLTTDGV